MSFEHERIHLETSSVLLREFPLPLVQRPAGWVADHPSKPPADVFDPVAGRDYPKNPMVDVKSGDVTLGKPHDWPSFGWDNEYGTASRSVGAFAASRFKVSNGEMLEFVKGGGYRQSRFWTEEGWSWRGYRNVKWPTFWTAVGPAGLHQYRLRTLFDSVPMPWAWPAEVNAHEARAFCAWRAEVDGRPYRLTREAEHLRIREASGLPLPRDDIHQTARDPVMDLAPAATIAAINHNLAYGTPANVDWAVSDDRTEGDVEASDGGAFAPFGDAIGNVWEWCDEAFHPLDGFEVHPYYDDFSAPCYDGKHSMIMGGSWASTGDEASVWSRFHFRDHFFQSAGFRLCSSGSGGSGYESEKLLHEYLMLHYADDGDAIPFAGGPREALRFPQRCAQLVDKWASKLELRKGRALDIGCAVGGSTFELARSFDSVHGVDLSSSFVDAAQRMKIEGGLPYFRRDQGELTSELGAHAVAELTPEVARTAHRATFARADACALPVELEAFDACLLANLLCRLPRPDDCLSRLGGEGGLVKPGGIAVIVSPYTSWYTWMEEHTPKAAWLGGFKNESGQSVYSNETLRARMEGFGFELLEEDNMPLLIREHQRKYQYIVSHAMIFRRHEE